MKASEETSKIAIQNVNTKLVPVYCQYKNDINITAHEILALEKHPSVTSSELKAHGGRGGG